MEEIWKTVKGYEGLYEVSNLGRIKSVSRIVAKKNGRDSFQKEIIRKNQMIQGYFLCGLCKNSKIKLHRVNRLVAQAFINPVSYTHLRAHETDSYLVCRL